MQTYAQRQQSLQLERWADRMLDSCKKKKKRVTSKSFGSTGANPAQGCDCDVLPWDDCEHTVDDSEALQNIRAHC